MTTDLKPDTADHLNDIIAEQNVQTEDEIARTIMEGFDEARRQRIADLLDSFLEGDPDEQRETFEILRKGLNEAHPDRPIFPPELKGITW